MNIERISMVHLILWKHLYKRGILDLITGEVYIHCEALRDYLGKVANVPRSDQLTAIKELTELGIIVLINRDNYKINPIDDYDSCKNRLNNEYYKRNLKAS